MKMSVISVSRIGHFLNTRILSILPKNERYERYIIKMAISAIEAIEAIKKTKGVVSQAAKRLGISRMQLHRIINDRSTVKEALTDAREEMKDFAESQLYKGMNDGNPTLIIFYLKTQAKDRGYVERQEIDHRGVIIEVKYGDRNGNGQPKATTPKTD